MAADAVAEIKSRLDVVEVIGSYVRLQKAGREYKGLCPFHAEKSPSFTVSHDRQVWYCFGCQEGGDMISFVQKIDNLDFPQTLQQLADRAGVEIETGGAGDSRAAARRRKVAVALNAKAQAYFEHVLWATPAGKPGRDLLAHRGLGEEIARQFGVGFAPVGGAGGDALVRYLTGRGISDSDIADAGLAHPTRHGSGARDRFRHRLVFPIRDPQGRTIAFGGRALSPDDRAKYLNSPETAVYHKGSALFGIDQAKAAIATASSVVIVEGYFDVLAAHTAGVRNVVASSGTALTSQQVAILARHTTTIVLCFDTDRAGRMATTRAIDLIAEAGLSARVCVMPQGVKDPDELVRTDPHAFADAVTNASPEWQVMLDWALAGHDGEGAEDRRRAVKAAGDVLQRIPEASTRALYADQVATRLRVPRDAIIDDMEHRRRSLRGAAALRPKVVAAIPVQREPAAGLDDEPQGHDIPAWEGYLGGVVVQRPATAEDLVMVHGLEVEMLRSPVVRRLIELARTLPPGSSFPVHALGEGDRRLAARLLLRTIPELGEGRGDAGLPRALAANVARVIRARRQEESADLEFELRRARDEGREADVEALVRRRHQLTTEIHRLVPR